MQSSIVLTFTHDYFLFAISKNNCVLIMMIRPEIAIDEEQRTFLTEQGFRYSRHVWVFNKNCRTLDDKF